MDQEVTERKLYLNPDLNRRHLMKIAGVDKNRFAAMMKQFANTNFSGYINAKRLEHAVHMMAENPEYTMKFISETCGFNSQSTFFRVFKGKYGVTPLEYGQNDNPQEAVDKQSDIIPNSPFGQNENTSRENTIRFFDAN